MSHDLRFAIDCPDAALLGEAAAAALLQLRRQVALETGGETSALYQRWKAPVNGLMSWRAARKTAA
jgi:hypothetical protein